MAVSTFTVKAVLKALEEFGDKGETVENLARITGLAQVTVREAIAIARMSYQIKKIAGTRPARYAIEAADKAVSNVTLIDHKMQKGIAKLDEKEKLDKSDFIQYIMSYYRSATRQNQEFIIKSLFNVAEYFYEKDFTNELKVEDFK